MNKKTDSGQVDITPAVDEDLQEQHKYVENLKKHDGYHLVAAEAFVRGMRDSGYKSTATALEDLTDNSFQANAQRIDVICTEKAGTKQGQGATVSSVAVIDDGHGMEPDMIRAAVMWGGTHRENNRSGFGRYGFGLPSAAVSIAEKYSVYSKVIGGEWNAVSIDLARIARGEHTNKGGIVVTPEAKQVVLPGFVLKFLGDRELKSGTVVVLEEPDRLTSGFRSAKSFKPKMMQTLGLTYRGLLRNHDIYVQGERVTVVDPLFLDSACRFYDIDNGHVAEALDPLNFSVKTADQKATGSVRVRFSYLHPKFNRDVDGKIVNGRNAITRDNNGFLTVTRAGRQIDVISRHKFPKKISGVPNICMSNDRFWVVEVDFDPILDEEFGVTVNKQQISISDRMWAILQDQGIPQAIAAMRSRWTVENDAANRKTKPDDVKISENVMQEAETFTPRKSKVSVEKQQQAKDRIENDAKQRAEESGDNVVEIVERIIAETREKPYKVMFESLRGAPFYRADKYGAQTRLFVNTAHRFYTDVYDAPDASPRVRTALELLMFVLGEAEMSASEERDMFYKGERQEWSTRLDTVLKLLGKRNSIDDARSALGAEEDDAASA